MISILMPIYNGIELIDESVSSVLNQTYTHWELIIGINGHPHNSEVYQIAKKYEEKNENIKVIDFFHLKGKSVTLNEMVKHCKYNYVAILDVDDIWHEQKLEVQSPFLNTHDVIGTLCIYFGESNLIPFVPSGDLKNQDFFHFNPIINSSSLIRKELCYWNAKYDGVEDYDLWLTLKKRGCSFYNCSNVLVKHRIHNQSSFNSKGNANQVPELLNYHRNN
jgi:glycosyltransferase involved in cell wall biosynthesis